jgi:hypothetical protein
MFDYSVTTTGAVKAAGASSDELPAASVSKEPVAMFRTKEVP